MEVARARTDEARGTAARWRKGSANKELKSGESKMKTPTPNFEGENAAGRKKERRKKDLEFVGSFGRK